MWISAGEHELVENIVHLVLAKIPGPDGKLIPGTRGISLFIVPKKMVGTDGRLTGERNDVALAGLNHKLGWRGTTNTLLNFGEGKYPVQGAAGAIGYLVGKPHEGLRCMFHMMNEARIGIGMAATSLGLAGYYASLEYARNRPQGRPLGLRPSADKNGNGASAVVQDAARPQVRIIEHADVKRMLLAQKSYGEGALALMLYCARLVDEQHTGSAEAADEARLLLEVLTPIAKSWPSEFCLEANSLAIQIHGGYGYTRDFPVEQYWRDNRLNMIHEGTHGIQASDLLGRKVLMEDGRGLQLLIQRVEATVGRARSTPELASHAEALATAMSQVGAATRDAWSGGDPGAALANAVPYMQAFGHVVLAWTWLDVSLTAISQPPGSVRREGCLGATTYFFHYELPKIGAWLGVVASRDPTCAGFPEEAF
jgi:butyryl-CoA dehydrogenase